MILTNISLRKWQASMFTVLSVQQSQAILERFGTEPEPHEWSQQDISIQIQNYLNCGEFVKPCTIRGDSFGSPKGNGF